MPRHVLLAVAGGTPATVTEAVHALAVDRKVPLAEVHVIATRGTATKLFADLEEVLGHMRRDFPKALRGLELTPHIIDVDDVRSAGENDIVANHILRAAHRLCGDTENVVHASLAGGRKTMSYYLGAAMELVGRPGDTLYHVLVSPEFEVPGFYYPAPAKSPLANTTIRGMPRPSREARIELVPVTFVRLRSRVEELLGTSPKSLPAFETLAARARDALDDDFMEVQVRLEGQGVEFLFDDGDENPPRVKFAKAGGKEPLVYAWLLRERAAGAESLHITDLASFEEHFRRLHAFALEFAGTAAKELDATYADWNGAQRQAAPGQPPPAEEFIQGNWYKRHFSEQPSRINARIREAFRRARPSRDPAKYFITIPGRGHLALTIPPGRIHFHFRNKQRGR